MKADSRSLGLLFSTIDVLYCDACYLSPWRVNTLVVEQPQDRDPPGQSLVRERSIAICQDDACRRFIPSVNHPINRLFVVSLRVSEGRMIQMDPESDHDLWCMQMKSLTNCFVNEWIRIISGIFPYGFVAPV